MELFFLALLVLLMVAALGMGYPVAFALPGSAILAITAAALCGTIFAGSADAYFAQGGPIQWLNAGVTNFRGIYWEVERDTLIAIPLFIFMGIMLERSKIAEDLLVTMAQLFGPIPGGLGISVVFVGALLAATTGIVGATVIAMGLIALPVMMRNNYSHSLATGTIAASGTLGQIIPPSIVLIILADQLASATDQASTLRAAAYRAATGEFSMPLEFDLSTTSAGDMFMGALMPGMVLVGLYMAYIFIFAIIRKKSAPPVPYEGKYDGQFLKRVALALTPPLSLIFIVLGSIVMGIATVNQAGSIGAVGAMIMAGYRLKEGQRGAYLPAFISLASVGAIVILLALFDINIKSIEDGGDLVVVLLAMVAVAGLLFGLIWSGWRTYKIDNTLTGVMIETAKTTSLVFIILLGAAMLTAAFRAFGGEELVKDFLTGLPGGFATKFVVVMAVIFVLGFFLDFIEIAVVVVPIVAPILLADPSANVSAVWLGVMIGVNMQTSFLTPPFGFALFYLRGVASAAVTTVQMYFGVIPFILLQLTALVVVGFYPSLVNYLPNRTSLTSDTAPPPVNPTLQYCIEVVVFETYDDDGDSLRNAMTTAAALDISFLPENLRETLSEAFIAAPLTFDKVAEVRATEAAVGEFTVDYRPLHREVRALQSEIARVGEELEEFETTLRRESRREGTSPEIFAAMERRIEALTVEKSEIEAVIPDQWDAAREQYLDLATAEKRARTGYRRNVDNAYQPVAEIRTIIAGTQALAAQESQINDLGALIRNAASGEIIDAISVVETALTPIAGASPIKSKLGEARRAIDDDTPDMAKATTLIAEASTLYATDLAWRTRAESELASGLEAYDEAIRETIGIRRQDRLPRPIAKAVAACKSIHYDISLNF